MVLFLLSLPGVYNLILIRVLAKWKVKVQVNRAAGVNNGFATTQVPATAVLHSNKRGGEAGLLPYLTIPQAPALPVDVTGVQLTNGFIPLVIRSPKWDNTPVPPRGAMNVAIGPDGLELRHLVPSMILFPHAA